VNEIAQVVEVERDAAQQQGETAAQGVHGQRMSAGAMKVKIR
jgi:peptidyl-tRNA hydrolase